MKEDELMNNYQVYKKDLDTLQNLNQSLQNKIKSFNKEYFEIPALGKRKKNLLVDTSDLDDDFDDCTNSQLGRQIIQLRDRSKESSLQTEHAEDQIYELIQKFQFLTEQLG